MVKRWMCDPESTCQHPEGQYVDLIDFVRVHEQNALLAAENERLRELFNEIEYIVNVRPYRTEAFSEISKIARKAMEGRDEERQR